MHFTAPCAVGSAFFSSSLHQKDGLCEKKKKTLDGGASFRCVGRLACVTEFGHLIYVFIRIILFGYLQRLWGL